MPIQLLVSKLAEYCSPLNRDIVWEGIGDYITRDEISLAIMEQRLHSKPLPDSYDAEVTRQQHIERIAYLVVHRCEDPIQIDVGVPELGCYVNWMLEDGNHRMAAAQYRGDEFITAQVGGDLGYARVLFDMDCTDPEYANTYGE